MTTQNRWQLLIKKMGFFLFTYPYLAIYTNCCKLQHVFLKMQSMYKKIKHSNVNKYMCVKQIFCANNIKLQYYVNKKGNTHTNSCSNQLLFKNAKGFYIVDGILEHFLQKRQHITIILFLRPCHLFVIFKFLNIWQK